MSAYNFENDPFADPSITAATNKANNAISGLEDYNPFADQPTANIDPFSPTTPNVPTSTTTPTTAVLSSSNTFQTVNEPTQTFTKSSNDLTAEQLRQRQEELDRKAAELAAREAELQRAQRLTVRENNFPPLPSFLPCQPCFYLDINVEIEVNFQNIVRQVYKLWIAYIIALLVNFLGCLSALIEGVENGGGMFTFALVTVIIFTPLSFVCWFRPIYKAFRDDSSFSFMVFFFVFFCQLVLSATWALGIPGTGSIGLFTTLKYLSQNTSILFRLVCFICFFVQTAFALASLFMLIKIHGIYHKSSASIQKAQEEFTSRVLSNERVQQMASNAAQTAARQAMNQAMNPNATPNSATGFRY